ncbi:NADH-quinone oxidoreductase subunit NuoG [Luteimonas sp. 3794]|uniref:NADH-quinone oxidoreductase subunit NuoG n=1 Tax=Luteimonas sp. 3794 TaxID=2817730 RepID=UPI002862DC49|nr:NADH-quinone oxidoreductase subunit NuoG [Luteimonas sp. 3794]MDR6992280.1 NADH-quinone oxidoreductase subunit G [Luteimonas sp. 3794]
MSAQPVNPNLPPDHVTVFIDGVELAAPKGSMIIHAADKAGIPIPRFCYHDKLEIAANCRMCLVDTEVGGRGAPKPSPACATPVMDGLKVFTRNEKALKAQRNVMEFLLINHPLDCPICDQGGECELQDLSLGYGRSVSRFAERKRVVADEDLGPLVATEMTRCIQCTRCVRFTAEIAGTYELGGMQRGENLQIGTYDGKPLTTELSGNVIDVCPVGALTNKVFRFRARPWELIARESLGGHDALGSNLFHHLRRGDVMRTVPRDNEAVNECWISDRDRYSHQGLTADDRAVHPLVKDGGQWREASWDEALERAMTILRDNAADELGVLVHPSTSNEEGALLARLADALGTGNLDHRIAQRDLSDGAIAEAFAMPVAELEQADVVLLVGSHLRHEVPLLHHRVRQAWKRGAKVYVVNPVDFEFTFDIEDKAIVAPSKIAETLQVAELGDALRGAKHAAIIVGAQAEASAHAADIRKAAAALAADTGASLCRIPHGANALGLSRHGVLPTARDANAMLSEGRGAYVIYGIEPGLDFADQAKALQALGAAQVVAFSHFACQSTRAVADVILPIGALAEIDATLTNLEGRDQQATAAGKLPGDARAGWRVLRALGGALEAPGFEFTDLAGLRAGLQGKTVSVAASAAPVVDGDGFELAVSQAIYRVDGLTRRAAALQSHPLTIGPRIVLHPDDAAASNVADGGMAKVSNSVGTATLQVAIDDRVAPGAAWVESGYGATAALSAGKVKVVAA